MVWVTLGLGSGVDPENQLRAGLDSLLLHFNDLALSSIFESEPVGFEGNNFLNMAVGFDTEIKLQELSGLLKEIEDKSGRDRSKEKFQDQNLDIDILTYDKHVGEFGGIKLPRPGIVENAYVLWPLSQISGNKRHPELKQSYVELWKNYISEEQRLWPIDFKWHGRMISHSAPKKKH